MSISDHEFAQTGGIPLRSHSDADTADRLTNGRIRYIEAKAPDWRRLAELCHRSGELNQWTNDGPLSLALGQIVNRFWSVPAAYCTVMASSGTAALYAATGISSAKAGKPLRWAISAFGFAATTAGPFAGMTVPVDCGTDGFLDLSALARLPDDAWDGLLVTRVFGLQRDMSPYIDFCNERHKPLIIDAALGFPATSHPSSDLVEIVSFHHTKPWGFGEAGCLFVHKEDEALARSMLSVANELPSHVSPSVSNGKLSDMAAAAVIDRLERISLWSPRYRAQQLRIGHLASQVGLACLGSYDNAAIAASVPVLASAPLRLEQLPDAGFDCRKYYAPLSTTAETAAAIHARIINIPCHSDMAAITDEQILAILQCMAQV